MGRYGNHHGKFEVSQDYDSSENKVATEPEVTEEWNSNDIRHKSSIVEKIKEKYQKYNSPDARMERRSNTLAKRARKINDLSYVAKKEQLNATIRKSRATANTGFGFGPSSSAKMPRSREGTVHLPPTNYGSMDRMFGIGTQPAKQSKSKSVPKTTLTWGNMDKMFGI